MNPDFATNPLTALDALLTSLDFRVFFVLFCFLFLSYNRENDTDLLEL